jgi:riboflavin synthase
MFTGLVQSVGYLQKVEKIQPQHPQSGIRVVIECPSWDLSDVTEGDSIAINGACMTVISRTNKEFVVEVSHESLSCTTGWQVGLRVNLEKSLRASDFLGGHWVSGHVDGVCTVKSIQAVAESTLFTFSIPKDFSPFLVQKGSICLHGVSLTINDLQDKEKHSDISINIIPHTLTHTNLSDLQEKQIVNFEIDMMSRQVARYISLYVEQKGLIQP